MRISDWSSDVCSSDLLVPYAAADQGAPKRRGVRDTALLGVRLAGADDLVDDRLVVLVEQLHGRTEHDQIGRSSCRERGVSVRVDLGGRRTLKKQTKNKS